MSDQRTEQTQAVSSALGEFEKPTRIVDLDAVGAEYLWKAHTDTCIARWNHFCPPELKQTDWQDQRIAAYAERHAKIIGWQYQKLGLLATGPSGFRKSGAMWCLMRRLAAEGRESRYFTAAEWFSTLQSHVNYGRDDSMGWIRSIARVPIVFIDDLGQEAMQANRQDWAQGWLFQFLDIRLGLGLPLFVTTNLSAREMAGQHTDTRANPLVRRLLELCEVVKF